jgi:2-keto-4-pentenoate hydratase/2-oxohepta-3-ene-1,7-dioic acid hydratase in catechol pathway
MRRVRFRDPAGTRRTGEWLGGGNRSDIGEPSREDEEGDRQVRFGDRTYPVEDVDVLAPCEPTKLVCVGRNYAGHAAEQDSAVPDRPLLFLKGPNAVATHDSTIRLPAGKERIEFEAELGVVIGEQCRGVDEEAAMDVVAGFTCGNDLSNRDDQRAERNWVRGKAFDNAAPLGPVLATPEEVPADASIRLWVNEELRQDGSRADLLCTVPELIVEITTYLTLEPGDVVLTGTPAGVGPLADGDTVTIGIEGIGTLRHSVAVP